MARNPKLLRLVDRLARRVTRSRVGARASLAGFDGVDDFEVAPQVTDARIDNWLDSHYVAINRAGNTMDRVLLFLPGSFGAPLRQRLIVQLAAWLGFNAINLSYPNSWTVGGLCRDTGDHDCHEKVRLEIIDGVPRTDLVNMGGSAQSILNRFGRLLMHLADERPDEGWARYLDGSVPRWQSVVVAGHSQGGGHAALLGKLWPVHRVILLGAPADHDRATDSLAPWIGKPGATPAERYFGFAHRLDQGFERICGSWEGLGLAEFGPLANVEEQVPPYGDSRQLVTDASSVGRRYHASVAVDAATPVDENGRPRFMPVWKYLLGG